MSVTLNPIGRTELLQKAEALGWPTCTVGHRVFATRTDWFERVFGLYAAERRVLWEQLVALEREQQQRESTTTRKRRSRT